MPTAWQVLSFEWWGLDKVATWNTWQALASCQWSEVRTFRQQLLLWPTIRSGKEAAVQHGLTPQSVLRLIEMLVQNHCLSRKEAAVVEEAILTQVSATGMWR